MAIEYKHGDIIEAFKRKEITVLAHCVNCFNTMGAGIALSIKNEFPKVYKSDQQTRKGDRNKLGKVIYVPIEGLGVVANCYGQYTYWDKTDMIDYAAVKTFLTYLDMTIPTTGVIGFPYKMCCGYCNGNWDTIVSYMNKIFTNRTVYVYSLYETIESSTNVIPEKVSETILYSKMKLMLSEISQKSYMFKSAEDQALYIRLNSLLNLLNQ